MGGRKPASKRLAGTKMCPIMLGGQNLTLIKTHSGAKWTFNNLQVLYLLQTLSNAIPELVFVWFSINCCQILKLFHKFKFQKSSKGKWKCLGGQFFSPGQWFGHPWCSSTRIYIMQLYFICYSKVTLPMSAYVFLREEEIQFRNNIFDNIST